MKVYHTGFNRIEFPNIDSGRINADFGQGFYLSPDYDFAKNWENSTGKIVFLNEYDFDDNNLKIKTFEKDEEWFNYIINNRFNKKDYLNDFDVIIGPIANDTIFDTLGIISSNLLSKTEALKLLEIGPNYTQIVIKSQKALDNLHFKRFTILDEEDIIKNHELFKKQEEEYQRQFSKVVKTFM